MHVLSVKCLALLQLLSSLVLGIPAPDSAIQRLLQIPPGRSQDVLGLGNPPYTPGHRDPFDHKIDSVGDDRHPLPYRGGDGASIEGPRNLDREKQNPDLVRPPSTDHGSMSNMRWSFADSHVRIEVRHRNPVLLFGSNESSGGRMDEANNHS